ncbi:T9SS type A sorting domain-containing protein [candidate division KSB1 bacterium]|nr:T9SS type A sorting domain-containing protein [candidate division KSB1 bacterium]
MVFLILLPLYSQTTIGFDAFTSDSYYASPLQFTEDDLPFVLTDTGGEAGYEFHSMASYPGELEMGDTGGSGASIKTTITHSNGWLFDLNSIDLMVLISAPTWIIKGYKSGVQVSGSPVTFSLVNGDAYKTINTNFQQVDMVTLEENPVYAGGYKIWCDQFVVDNVTDASLPVELSSFSAEPVADGVQIKWTTESEVNNLGFVLERANGHSSLQWDEIASYQTHPDLQGQGNTSSKTEYQFTDETVQPGETYSYRLSDVNIKGDMNILDVISITLDDLPEETALEPPFPNPFNPQTKISYQLSGSGRVQIAVYDLLGRKVSTLLNGEQSAGSYNIYWHGKDDTGRQASTGTYILRLIAGDVVKSQKVLLMR